MEGVVLERSSVPGARSDARLVRKLLREIRELRREAAELREEVAELRAENLELRQQSDIGRKCIAGRRIGLRSWSSMSTDSRGESAAAGAAIRLPDRSDRHRPLVAVGRSG